VPAKTVAKPEGEAAKQITVKNGDNASKIAAKVKAASVSLDQMLVALMRANPDAFVNNNLNRIRAGAVMDVPTTEQAQSVSKSDASQMVVAQSKDFNDFRGKLAANAPKVATGTADRKVSGTVEAKVEDKKPANAVPDKLTLSKGSVQAKADEARIAKERADKDAASRAAEIAKNISDLTKINSASKATAPASASATPAPVAPAADNKANPAPAVAAVTTPAIASAASAPVAPAPVAAASTPPQAAPVTKKAPPAPVVPTPEEPGLVDQLLEDPVIPAAAGGLLAVLGGFAFYRMRQRRKNSAQVDSSFLESRLQPDSFFGASGGQRVDTNNDGPASNSSMVYSASQLDAADDVDPVAEADVYLAYGRDLQAEEILKEAVRTNPSRLAIHTKLMEIFAKRRDAKSFETSAGQAFKLTGSSSPEWAKICELGLTIDPENPLYQPGSNPTESAFAGLGGEETAAFAQSTVAQSASPDFSESKAVDLDLDLDFSADDEPASAINDITGSTMETPVPSATETVKMEAEDSGHMSLDFDISGPAELAVAATPALPEISLSMDGIGQDAPPATEALKFDVTSPMQVAPVATTTPESEKDTGMLEFDMGSLSLDLDTPSEHPSEAPSTTGEDPLETKLALADEFISIGDDDGARALIEEVIAEATGDMRAKAQRALASLS
jgi:pilus assembly protein FimV